MDIWHIFNTDISCWIKDHNLLLKLVKTELLVVPLNPLFPHNLKAKVTWHTVKYGDPYSEFLLYIYPSKCTHTALNTHTVNTHTQSSGQPFMLRRPGSSWGFGALLKGTSSWYWSRRERCTFTDTDTSQPFDYKSDSLPLRTQLMYNLLHLRILLCVYMWT